MSARFMSAGSGFMADMRPCFSAMSVGVPLGLLARCSMSARGHQAIQPAADACGRKDG